MHHGEAHWHSHRRRRRPGPQFGHQSGCLSWRRHGMRGHRHPPRMGRADPRRSRRSRQQGALHPAAQPREHAHHRPHRRHLSAQLAAPIPPRWRSCRPRLAGQQFPSRRNDQEGRHQHGLRRHAGGAEEHRDARPRLPGRHRRRRHAQLRRRTRPPGRQGHRRAQDHGQRRPQHRVLHRLLHRHHPRHGRHRAPAHHRRLARAHRHLPRVRPRRRLHRALHGLCHVDPLLHSRVQGRTRRISSNC